MRPVCFYSRVNIQDFYTRPCHRTWLFYLHGVVRYAFFSFFVGGHYAGAFYPVSFGGLQGIKLQSFPAARPQAPFRVFPFSACHGNSDAALCAFSLAAPPLRFAVDCSSGSSRGCAVGNADALFLKNSKGITNKMPQP